jgi:hypothetical protein
MRPCVLVPMHDELTVSQAAITMAGNSGHRNDHAPVLIVISTKLLDETSAPPSKPMPMATTTHIKSASERLSALPPTAWNGLDFRMIHKSLIFGIRGAAKIDASSLLHNAYIPVT